MSNKHALLVLAAILMGAPTFATILLPESQQATRLRIGFALLFLLGIACLWWQARILSREDREDDKQRIESDARFEELGKAILRLPTQHKELRDKVLGLGHDLFTFLREKGPDADIGAPKDAETTYDYLMRVSEARGPRVEGIHYGYLAKFRQRGIDLFNELREQGIQFDLDQWEIDPPQVARENYVRHIAEECFLIAARMDVQQAARGT
jgi:hypothetical protein